MTEHACCFQYHLISVQPQCNPSANVTDPPKGRLIHTHPAGPSTVGIHKTSCSILLIVPKLRKTQNILNYREMCING